MRMLGPNRLRLETYSDNRREKGRQHLTNPQGAQVSHDLVLQTKIGREETLEKFLHHWQKGTIKDPCAVRLRRVNREEFEARWAQKARALQIDANWIEPGLKLKNFKLFCDRHGFHFF